MEVGVARAPHEMSVAEAECGKCSRKEGTRREKENWTEKVWSKIGLGRMWRQVRGDTPRHCRGAVPSERAQAAVAVRHTALLAR